MIPRSNPARLTLSAIGGAALLGSALAAIAAARPDDVLVALIGDRPVVANVAMGAVCSAAVCMRGPSPLLVGVKLVGPFERTQIEALATRGEVLRVGK